MLKEHDPIKRERLLKAAELVERGIEGLAFDMEWLKSPGRACGCAGCIAGHIAAHLDPERYFQQSFGGQFSIIFESRTYRLARDHLHLTDAEADRLFMPDNLEDITRAQAVAVLRHFAETAVIDYDAFAEAG